MDVATVDDVRAQLLRDVFWDMNVIAYEVTEYELEVDVLDNDGVPTGETYTEKIVVLRITVNAVSVSEMSALYGFTAGQHRWLAFPVFTISPNVKQIIPPVRFALIIANVSIFSYLQFSTQYRPMANRQTKYTFRIAQKHEHGTAKFRVGAAEIYP